MLRGGEMPCGACVVGFNQKPCEHLTGTIDGEEAIRKYVGRYIPHEKDGFVLCMVACYKELHYNCPCRECLVKITCNLKFDERCDEYKELINKIHRIYYDEINGQYKPIE